jgi:hypothetical protein
MPIDRKVALEQAWEAVRVRYAAAADLCAANDQLVHVVRWLPTDEMARKTATHRVEEATAAYQRATAVATSWLLLLTSDGFPSSRDERRQWVERASTARRLEW